MSKQNSSKRAYQLVKVPHRNRVGPHLSSEEKDRQNIGQMDGWMDDLRFYVLFNSISVISGRCIDDNERLCAMELRLRLRRFHLE